MESVNPATGERLETYDDHSDTAVADLIERADGAFPDWRDRGIGERERLLAAAGDVLRANVDRYAELISREMGKPVSQSRSEVEKCAWVCDYYAERTAEHLQDETVGVGPEATASVAYQPLGPVLAVMPWNFPFWQVFRFAAPHLTAGNVGLLKHAANVPGCAEAIEEVFREAGYPEGVFTTLLIESDRVEDVIRDDRVAAVTLTGSVGAGRAVASTAGEELKKSVLELGGSDPFVVLDDAPLDRAAEVGARARNLNSGQSCIAAKRFVVHEAVHDEFLDRFVDEIEALDVGDPLNEGTDVGPQARPDLLDNLHEQVRASVDAGAEVLTGGGPMDREGSFYEPTVLADVPRDCPAATEEVFGPVAAVFEVSDEEEAVELANDSHLGLGASVWTGDPDRGERLARRLEAGCTFVNELVKSDPRVPFGGVKDSGYGRELGRPGIREFVNRKTVWVERDVDGDDDAPQVE